MARLRAALRRAAPAEEQPRVETEAFRIDLAAKHVVDADDEPVHLTPIEWSLLEILVRNPGRLVTQRHLLQEVWGPEYVDETNYLRVHLAHLRASWSPSPPTPGTSSPSPGWATASRGSRPDTNLTSVLAPAMRRAGRRGGRNGRQWQASTRCGRATGPPEAMGSGAVSAS